MAELLSRLYKRNLLYQQVDFKWRSYTYLRRLVRTLPCRQHSTWAGRALIVSALVIVYLFDFLLGCTAALVIQRYGLHAYLDRGVSTYTLTILHWTKQLVTWTMGIPAGLKLNSPLAHFLGGRCLTILELWNVFYVDFIATYLTKILSVILLTSPFGVTVLLSVLHDFLKFLNLCPICFLIVIFRVFALQVSALKSLARLFMGKKWNVLRERVDSCDYDTNQLLLGTVLFTVLLFLLPTTGIYLVIFLLLRLLQFSVQLVLRISTTVVNKITVNCWILLYVSLKDAPISRVTVTLEGSSEGEGEGGVEVKVMWNGQRYSLEELKEVVESYPISKALSELNGEREDGLDGAMQSHPMLSWSDQLLLFAKLYS